MPGGRIAGSRNRPRDLPRPNAVTAQSDPRPVRAIDVIWFNWPTYLGAILVIVVGIAVLASPGVPAPLRVPVAIGIALTAWWLLASSLVSWWVYEGSGVTRWRWLGSVVTSPPSSWLNVTTGFDDTSEPLAVVFPDGGGTSIDVFDPHARHDGPALRARRTRPPRGLTAAPGGPLPAAAGSFDAVFLLMAAHEIRDGGNRRALLAETARVLRPTGRVVLVEHLRNLVNAIVFGPGVPHFLGRATWLADASAAGLRLVEDRSLTPFASRLVFAPAPKTTRSAPDQP